MFLGSEWGVLLNGAVSILQDEKVPEADGGDGHTKCECTLATELCPQRWLRW